jgi:hypothetical protein
MSLGAQSRDDTPLAADTPCAKRHVSQTPGRERPGILDAAGRPSVSGGRRGRLTPPARSFVMAPLAPAAALAGRPIVAPFSRAVTQSRDLQCYCESATMPAVDINMVEISLSPPLSVSVKTLGSNVGSWGTAECRSGIPCAQLRSKPGGGSCISMHVWIIVYSSRVSNPRIGTAASRPSV